MSEEGHKKIIFRAHKEYLDLYKDRVVITPCISTFLDNIDYTNKNKDEFLSYLQSCFDCALELFIFDISKKEKISIPRAKKKLDKIDEHLTKLCALISEPSVNVFLASCEKHKTRGMPFHHVFGTEINEFYKNFKAVLNEVNSKKTNGRPKNCITDKHYIIKELVISLASIYEEATGKRATRGNGENNKTTAFQRFIRKTEEYLKKVFDKNEAFRHLRIDEDRILREIKKSG